MLPYVVEICRGVQHAHENGILHRDLKPENVLVYRDAIFGEYCAVSDFGLGKHFDLPTATLTVTQASIGTPAYMAPEQMISTRTVDRTADVYAIGKVLYEALTGEFPMHMDVGLLGPRYRHIVTRCTQHDSRQRYQSVTEVMAALDLASGSGQGFVQPLSLFETLRVRLESASPTRVNLAQLSELFVSRIDDEAFLYTALPQLNKQVLLYLFTHHGVETARAIEAYDELIKGSVSFDYCDVAANFYERVYGATADLAVRQRVLLRLPVLGQRHNRWHVGEVFGRLVASTTDEGLLMAVRDMLISDPDLKAWVSPYLKTVPDVIRNAL